ncbi:MAG: extracellular solute-binding protein, partial [Dehalococcoidia bacterium]|nr:extracellular solute-binding protein [Dehalococcoidia bacterium]
MEDKTGAVPPYDMLSLSNHIAMANENGILEQVDWKPLLIQGTNPEAVNDNPLMRGSLVYTTAHFGIMYNADKVKPDEVPRTMADLADPKWKNKVGIETGGGSSVRWAFVLGKDKMIATYRDILKNGAITSRATTQYNRFLIGEIWFTRLSSTFLGTARKQGVRAEWQSLDFSDSTEFAAVVRKGARNPNAAKLVALYLASPEGVKFGSEENGYGSMYYPGNYEHDIRLQDQKQGIPEIFTSRKTDILEFYTSKEGRSWGKEIGLILQTGGGGKAKKKK